MENNKHEISVNLRNEINRCIDTVTMHNCMTYNTVLLKKAIRLMSYLHEMDEQVSEYCYWSLISKLSEYTLYSDTFVTDLMNCLYNADKEIAINIVDHINDDLSDNHSTGFEFVLINKNNFVYRLTDTRY